jgi:hypothetical protein
MDKPQPWPVDFGRQPEAAHAASEFVTDREDGIQSGLFVWPAVMVVAGILVAVLTVVLL